MSKAKKIKRGRAQKVVKSAEKTASSEKVEQLFGIKNYLFFGLGILVLILGYYFLAQPASDPNKLPAEGFLSLNVAPILLIVAYLVIIPIGILIRKSKKNDE